MAPKMNAYSIFVNDVFHERLRSGQAADKPALFQQLGDQWKNMPEEEKQVYKDRAKNGNIKPKSTNIGLEEKKPVVGQVSAVAVSLKRPHEDSLEEVRDKKPKPGIPNWHRIKHLNVDTSIQYCDIELYNMQKKCESIIKASPNEITTRPIYTISVNVMCKQVLKETKEEIYIPIELSIYAYSVEKGERGSYHVLIDAGEVPTGYRNATKDHAVNHKITIPGFDPTKGYPAEARSDYKRIYKEMLDFTQDGQRVVLIHEYRDHNQVRGSIDWLHKKAEAEGARYPSSKSWTILRIADFIATMHNSIYLTINDEPVFALRYYINHLISSSSSMDYNDNIMCDYHKKEENTTKHCAKSCAMRTISSIGAVLEDIFKLHRHCMNIKSQSETPSLPPSQSTSASRDSQLPEPEAPADRMELCPPSERPLAITAPPT